MLLMRTEIPKRQICRLLSRLMGRQMESRRTCACSASGEDYLVKMLTKHEFPPKKQGKGNCCSYHNEVEELKKTYPEPTKLITDLFQPLVETNRDRAPYLKCRPMFNEQMWKACLQFNFPQCFHVTGVHQDKEIAKEYAHLVACDMFMRLGFINEKNFSVFTPEKVLEILQDLASNTVLPRPKFKLKKVEMSSNNFFCDSAIKWTTRISVKWPLKFAVEGIGSSEENSKYEAALLAAHKLKSSGLIMKRNEKQEYILRPERVSLEDFNHTPDIGDFNPDCTIYVDASSKGFGAYLQIKGETGVRWLIERWEDDIKLKYFLPKYISSFGELYALVTALYTWKHKFVNKRVLCYSDCKTSVVLINRSVYLPKKIWCGNHKLCNIACTTTEKYKIHFLACHVSRRSNRLADKLSRLKVEQFKAEVPEAYTKSKKIKKLLFLEPLLTKKE